MTLKEIIESLDWLVEDGVATQGEINLVCHINGTTQATVDDICYAKTGFDYEQLRAES